LKGVSFGRERNIKEKKYVQEMEVPRTRHLASRKRRRDRELLPGKMEVPACMPIWHREDGMQVHESYETERIAMGLGMVYMNGTQATAYGMTADRVEEIRRAMHWRHVTLQGIRGV
jgi:hypothetical protein